MVNYFDKQRYEISDMLAQESLVKLLIILFKSIIR